MALVCSICNEVPEVPVVSPYGNIFEKRLVEKYIAQTGTDPVTGQPLTVEQLIEIKTPPMVKPRPATATSLPALCKILLDEWDAVMLALYTEKKQHQTTKQELSHTLYQHDSASRVISRLQKEVTAAREALATLKPQTANAVAAPISAGQQAQAQVESMESEESDVAEITEEIIQKLQDTAAFLTAERKKRGKTVPEGLATPESVTSYRQTASHVGLHSAGLPGILAVDICLRDTSKIVTGGNDKNAVVFNKNTESVVAVLQGHTKKVTNVVYHPEEELVFTGSQDHTIRVWGVQRSNSCAHVIRAHDGPVTGLSLHATGDYLLSCATDGYWAFSDIRSGKVLAKVQDSSNSNDALTCTKFHPDGQIFGTGTENSVVKIWDLKQKENAANFSGHQGAITSIAFSENGYHLATAAEDSVIKLWDLRKLKNFKSIPLKENYEVKSLCFDQSGTYLAVGGTDVRIYLSKQWTELAVFNDHTALATGVCFGHMASFLTSVSLDRSLKVFSL